MDEFIQLDQFCPSRALFAELTDKWSLMILYVLSHGDCRFNELKRRCAGISQKSLTQTLRRLERNGLVSRRVLDTSPVAVEYGITDMGRALSKPLKAMLEWAYEHTEAVSEARQKFDLKST
ncbi:putative HTH-type transcriptional regulator YybR [Ruegeria sp. THAF57]|uniref:winged helix-turn-helix transcriptional regulator n=1 Tax=Ruegeria sp. THAF57 TaxID=2744555 RepID=UPI0015DE190C|nr:helix-turn-helix domain-containing protein [Ruegeria sp. THAF57]CAD0187219.1 putative HTH-type transcriptional regulator YybR [Ruegeria sp. THAF57]